MANTEGNKSHYDQFQLPMRSEKEVRMINISPERATEYCSYNSIERHASESTGNVSP